MKKNSQLAVLLLVLATSVFAGGVTGGGNVIVCKSPAGAITSVRLLDYYEAEEMYPDLVVDLGVGKTEQDHINNVLARLKRLDSGRAVDYAILAKAFYTDVKWTTGKKLPAIGDEGHVIIPEGCVVDQIAVQDLSKFAGAKKYTVRQEYWDHLSNEDRAGLVLHEVAYNEALNDEYGKGAVLGSRGARYINILISSAAMSKMSQDEYMRYVESSGFAYPYPHSRVNCTAGFENNGVKIHVGKTYLYARMGSLFESHSNRPLEFTSYVSRLPFPIFRGDRAWSGILGSRENDISRHAGQYPIEIVATDGITTKTCTGKVIIQ